MASKRDVLKVLERRLQRVVNAPTEFPEELLAEEKTIKDKVENSYDKYGRLVITVEGVKVKFRRYIKIVDERYQEIQDEKEALRKERRKIIAQARKRYREIEEQILLNGVDKELIAAVDSFSEEFLN